MSTYLDLLGSVVLAVSVLEHGVASVSEEALEAVLTLQLARDLVQGVAC